MESKCHHIVALIILAVEAVTLSAICSPALKRKEYSFQVNFYHTVNEPLEIVWLRNKTPVSMCQSTMACYDYSDMKTFTTMTMSGDGSVHAKLVIKNVTDVDETIWSMKYLGMASLRNQEPLFSCKLSVYEYPAATLVNCPMMLEENEILNCTCAKNNETKADLEYSWYQTNGSLINNRGHSLALTASRQSSARAKKIVCVLNHIKRGCNVICFAQRVYPSAVCEFTFDGKKLPMDPVYDHHFGTNETLYYNTQCMVTLTDLTPGYYNIVVSVYPNVTGTDSDKIYSVIEHFTYKIESYNHTNVISIEVIQILPLLCLSILIVILFVIIMIKRSRRNNKDTLPDCLNGKKKLEENDIQNSFNKVEVDIISEKESFKLIDYCAVDPDLEEMGPLLKIKQKETLEKL